jgi:hypothetical protein
MQAHYLDGMHLYSYLSSNPLISRDPLGLYGDDAEIDDLIADITGQRLFALDAIATGAKVASIGLEASLEIALSLLPGAGLIDAAAAIGNSDGTLLGTLAVVGAAAPLAKGAISAVKAITKAARFSKIGGRFSRAASLLRPDRRIYSARVLVRSGEAADDAFHNFPMGFDEDIIAVGEAIEGANGYVQYTKRGTINGLSGVFEVGGRISESGGVLNITHRFFRPD